MENFILDDLIDQLFYKSGNKVVDDFIRYTQINCKLIVDMMEFVPYDQLEDIEFITKVEIYKATWIDGNIQGWNKKRIDFQRNGSKTVVLKKLNNSENIPSKGLNEVY